jgi:sorting nexin-1/2
METPASPSATHTSGTAPKSPGSRGTRGVSLAVGPRPDPPSVSVTAPAGYDEPTGTLQVEVSEPHRVGDGLSKHVEYKVTYWTTLPQYKSTSGCVTRRYSDFEWLWKMLRGSMDGIIVPAPPSKTLMPNDDPKSAAIDKRQANLALFIARVAAHPVMRESADLQVFLEEADKNSWSERVPWYERGVTSDALKGVSDWFHNTVRLDDTGTAANLLAGAAAGAAAAQGAAAAAASKARGAAAGAGAAPGGSPHAVDRVPMPALISGQPSTPASVAHLPGSPSATGRPGAAGFEGAPGATAPTDGILETQHFLEVAEYVSKLRGRVDKLLLATSALVKHSAHTGSVLMQFAAVVSDLEETENRAARSFHEARVAAAAASSASSAGSQTSGAESKIQWTDAAMLFVATSGPPRAQAEAVMAAFVEPLEAAAALCGACASACDARKAIVEHYNRLCRQIARLDAKIASMGVPEPGPKREEKQKVELAASDLRIERTQAMLRYERCVEHIERELLWWHTELATTLGLALKNVVAAQGAAAGHALHACVGHFDALGEAVANPPSAFVEQST